MKVNGKMKMGGIIIMIIILTYTPKMIESSPCNPTCSSNGYCDEDARNCICDDGYGGDDCSLKVIKIRDGEMKTESAGSRQFIYYETKYTPGAISLNYTLHQLNNGDCDLYVKSGNIPSRTIYDVKDTSISSDFNVIISVQKGVTIYAGVYGYRLCSFSLSLSTIFEREGCKNDCSGRGECVEGVCRCLPGYYADDCSHQTKELNREVKSYTNEVIEKNEWKYYSINAQSSPFSITLSPSSSSNIYIYLRSGSYPDLFNFDYRNGVVDRTKEGEILNTITIAIGSPLLENYFVGVYSTNDFIISYSLSLSFSGVGECEEECSGHGGCVEGLSTCSCDPFYSGPLCQTRDREIEEGEEYGGYIKGNGWNYYHLNPGQSHATIYISLFQIENSNSIEPMDCSLYIQKDQLPTKTSYYAREISMVTDDLIQLPILNPFDHIWYLGVFGFRYCNYSLSFSSLPQCTRACEVNGRCEGGECVCNDGWTGPSCSSQIERAEGAPAIYTGTIGADQWRYYVYNIPGESSLTSVLASLRELSSRGYINIYLKGGSKPTLDDYMEKDNNFSNDFHTVYTLVTPLMSRMIYIGVYGTPFIPYQQTVPYKFGLYSPHIIFPH